jgi:hypothetical protein
VLLRVLSIQKFIPIGQFFRVGQRDEIYQK